MRGKNNNNNNNNKCGKNAKEDNEKFNYLQRVST